MEIRFNVTGAERKRLANAISEHVNAPAKFLGPPTFSYQVDAFLIDRNGIVSFDAPIPEGDLRIMIDYLNSQGFTADVDNTSTADAETVEPEVEGLTITLPKDGFTESALENLKRLLDAKGTLIKKALGADRLDVEVSDEHVSFPWWDRMPGADETQAYMSFIAALSAMAKEAKRVTATEKEVESEKYAFRGFLLRLGFIGADSKSQRKLLLQNLSGSAAFPTQAKADSFLTAQKAKRDAAKEAVV